MREPTRGNNILDLILTKDENDICGVEVGGQVGNSDHSEIRFILKWHGRLCIKNNSIKVPDFRKENFEELRKHLAELSSEGVVGRVGISRGEARIGQVNDSGDGELVRSGISGGEGGTGLIGEGGDHGDDGPRYSEFIKY